MVKKKPSQAAVTLLVAMPTIQKGVFKESVLLMLEENASGSMGVIVNKHNPSDLAMLLSVQKSEQWQQLAKVPHEVLYGGPVNDLFGWVLHAPLPEGEPGIKTMAAHPELLFSAGKDFWGLSHDLAPKVYEMGFGYAGWLPGQLAEEVANNFWLKMDFSFSKLFTLPYPKRWPFLIHALGINSKRWVGQSSPTLM